MKRLTDTVFVAGQINERDFDQLAAAGIKTIINNRPDGEAMFQPKTADLATKAGEKGMAFHDIPVSGNQIAPSHVEAFGSLIENAEKPILAFCRSGTRSCILWAMSQSGDGDIDEIIGAAAGAGYDFRGYRPLFESMKNNP